MNRYRGPGAAEPPDALAPVAVAVPASPLVPPKAATPAVVGMAAVAAARLVADAARLGRLRREDCAGDAAGCPFARLAPPPMASDRCAGPVQAAQPHPAARWPGAAHHRPAAGRSGDARHRGHAGPLPIPPFEPLPPAPAARA